MNNRSRVLAALLAMALMAACGSSPPVRYYTLHPLEVSYEPDPEGAPVLDLGPLRLPEYISRTQIVTQGPGAEMLVDEFHRWAEPLNDAIHRVVALNVDNLVHGVIVVAYPNSNLIDADYRLQGSIVRFDVDTSGQAVLIVQWGIAMSDGEHVVAPRRNRFTAQAARGDDPGEIARALNDTLTQFSRDIADEIEARLL